MGRGGLVSATPVPFTPPALRPLPAKALTAPAENSLPRWSRGSREVSPWVPTMLTDILSHVPAPKASAVDTRTLYSVMILTQVWLPTAGKAAEPSSPRDLPRPNLARPWSDYWLIKADYCCPLPSAQGTSSPPPKAGPGRGGEAWGGAERLKGRDAEGSSALLAGTWRDWCPEVGGTGSSSGGAVRHLHFSGVRATFMPLFVSLPSEPLKAYAGPPPHLLQLFLAYSHYFISFKK